MLVSRFRVSRRSALFFSVSLSAVSFHNATDNVSGELAAGSVATGIPLSLGWYEIPNTALQSVCPPASHYPEIQGNEGCSAVVNDWAGGVADTKRNRLIFWGGGHAGYFGNEVYAVDLKDLRIHRLTRPSVPINGCEPAYPDGQIATRHNYAGMTYIPTLDVVYYWGGSVPRPAGYPDSCSGTSQADYIGWGGRANDTWVFNFSNNRWVRKDPANKARGCSGKCRPGTDYANLGSGATADYDPVSEKVFITDTATFYSYDPKSNTYARVFKGGQFIPSGGVVGALDPVRRLFIMFGSGEVHAFNIETNTASDWTNQVSGCSALMNANSPGLAYDSAQQRIVGWTGGNAVYVFNPDTKACTATTYPNGPGAAVANGTFGRFRYFPQLRVFGLVNNWQQNAYILRLTPPETASPLSVKQRM